MIKLYVFDVINAWDSNAAVNIQYIMNEKVYVGQYREATPAEIDSAAGVAELREQYAAEHDELMKARASLWSKDISIKAMIAEGAKRESDFMDKCQAMAIDYDKMRRQDKATVLASMSQVESLRQQIATLEAKARMIKGIDDPLISNLVSDLKEARAQRDKLLEAAKQLTGIEVVAHYWDGHWDLTDDFWVKWRLLQAAIAACEPEETPLANDPKGYQGVD